MSRAKIRKYKFIRNICHNDEILLMYHSGEQGGGWMNLAGGLQETAKFLMEKSDEIKEFILESALQYLREYEIQKQEFAKKLYQN